MEGRLRERTGRRSGSAAGTFPSARTQLCLKELVLLSFPPLSLLFVRPHHTALLEVSWVCCCVSGLLVFVLLCPRQEHGLPSLCWPTPPPLRPGSAVTLRLPPSYCCPGPALTSALTTMASFVITVTKL